MREVCQGYMWWFQQGTKGVMVTCALLLQVTSPGKESVLAFFVLFGAVNYIVLSGYEIVLAWF
jgi:hypothetical protein